MPRRGRSYAETLLERLRDHEYAVEYLNAVLAGDGPDATGMPGLGKDMTTSEFIESKSDEELVEFIKQGRGIDDPLNTTGVPMPPMGANPTLTDADVLAIVQFIRSIRN